MTPFETLEAELVRTKADLADARAEIQVLATRLGTAAHFAEFPSDGTPGAMPAACAGELAHAAETLLNLVEDADMRAAIQSLGSSTPMLEAVLTLKDCVREFRAASVAKSPVLS